MKYDIIFSCGHKEERDIFGKASERERKVSYWERCGICSACYRAQMSAKRAEENQAAAEAAKAEGLTKLEGSEKQIAWAMTIRKGMLDYISVAETKLAEMIASGTQIESATLASERAKRIRVYIEAKTDARWFIDNRDVSYNRLFASIAREIGCK